MHSTPLDQLAEGMRIALVLFAVMVMTTRAELVSGVSEGARLLAIQQNRRSWSTMALSALILSPVRALALAHHPLSPIVTRAAEVTAAGLACWTFTGVLATRALMRGATLRRMTWGRLVNLGVVAATLGATWVVR